MNKQHTIRESFSLVGKGLYTGTYVNISFHPAPENHGYQVKRVDLEGHPIIKAIAENVLTGSQKRGTTISNGRNVSICAVEHAFAALYALEVDNCLIEVNSSEFPILDGSALAYIREIECVGLKEQSIERDYYIVKKKIEIFDEIGKSNIVVLPDSHLTINALVSFDSTFFDNQFAVLNRVEDFKKDIAASRKVVLISEIEYLLNNNLIQSTDLDNMIIIYERSFSEQKLKNLLDKIDLLNNDSLKLGYFANKPLIYSNEPARHKLLDILGDLSFVGKPIRGKVIVTCPNHDINNKLARFLRKDLRANNPQAPEYNPDKPPLMDIDRIRKLLPHRYPFLLVDKIIDIGEKYIVGVKNVSINEPFFQGHFPEEPIMPGVLLLEAMAQVGGLLVMNTLSDDPALYSTYFMKIDSVKFRQKVLPGDTLIFHLKFISEIRGSISEMKGNCFVGNKLVCEAELMAQIIKN